MTRPLLFAWLFASLALPVAAQDRDTKVRNDREKFVDADGWIYNDLDLAFKNARRDTKPLLVVYRCIP